MKHSTDRILVTHAGRLSGPPDFIEMDLKKRRYEPIDDSAYEELRRRSIAGVVKRQADIGIDIVSDGELGKSRGYNYYSQRITGIAERDLRPGETAITIEKTREREKFKEFYVDVDRERARVNQTVPPNKKIVCVGPLKHKGVGILDSEIATFKSALAAVKVTDAFFPVLAPGWLDHFIFNEYYKTDEEYVFALADILAPEYRRIVGSGLILQIDDPGLPDAWPTFFPEPSVEEYRKYARVRIDALNHALAGIPEDRIRYHICWGSQHGPHVDDVPFRHVIDLLLMVNAQAYSIEAGNARHEHEWKIWRDVKLPEGKILIPGVVSHATNIVEHPKLVSDRLVQFAGLVGRENVMAGTDCGMGGRTHPQVGWAKLEVLAEGAALASKELWRK